MSSVFEERTRDCQRALATSDADGVVLFPSSNLYYAAGFDEEPGERHLLLCISREGEPVFVAPAMYEEQIREESWVEDVRTWDDGDDPRALVGEVLDELAIEERILLDDRMWALFVQDLRAVRPDATFGLASEVIDDLRMRKDEHELDALRRAGAFSDAVSEEIRSLGEDAIGMTERELAKEIDGLLSEGESTGPSFGTIVGAGANGAKPHHRHSDHVIQKGEPVVLDFGGTVDMYPGDQTRTVVFDGDPPEGFERVYEAVFVAQEAAVQAVGPGVTAGEVDRAARDVITNYGFGDEFFHRTGHGVGLSVHEEPYIVAGNERPLEPGMVFSIEPGVYLEGQYGVRIEDLVAVTEDGCERLNDSPWTWKPL